MTPSEAKGDFYATRYNLQNLRTYMTPSEVKGDFYATRYLIWI